jgi:hypothetical protein
LLAALANPGNTEADDLTNGTYRAWLRAEPVRQVIDATVKRSNGACMPYALTEERFTWIFENGVDAKGDCIQPTQLRTVFVQLALAPREEQGK